MSRYVLIADDEPHIARILAMTLTRAGYEVRTVGNGADALESIRMRAPDLLISDIEMPRMSGRQLLEALAQEFPVRDFPIFIMTARTNLEYRAWADEFPGLRFLEKPVSARYLVRRLSQLFERVAT